jgi:hypothetical protein
MACQREVRKCQSAVVDFEICAFGREDLHKALNNGCDRVAEAAACRRAELMPVECEEFRQLAFESVGMGAWRWDLRSGLVRADELLQRLWGAPFPICRAPFRSIPNG